MNTEKPVCSVLVSAYNAAHFLPTCLDSLLAQTLEDVEVLVVDDGSTDDTWALASRYAQRHASVRVLRLEQNQGQAYACNRALEMARGEFVCFLDSDDWYAPDALEQAVKVFRQYPQTDCVLFDVVKWYSAEEQAEVRMEPFEVLTGREAFMKSLSWAIHGVYMVRTEIHRQFPYDDTCRAYSNDNTTRLHFYVARQVRHCAGRYFYRQHSASVTHQVSLRHFDHLRANESMLAHLHRLGVDESVLRFYENQRWLVLVDSYRFYYIHRQQFTAMERQRALAEMRRIWRGIDVGSLQMRHRCKLGYMPLRPCWRLFCLQEEIYFVLKQITHRL